MSVFDRANVQRQSNVSRQSNVKHQSNRKAASKGTKFQGLFQQLEDRRLLATYTVDILLDDSSGVADGQVSLREAIMAAESNSAFGDAAAGDVTGDSIVFDAALDGMTIDISGIGTFNLSDDLTIGDANTSVRIDADGASRIFSIDSSEEFSLVNMELTGGNAADSGGAIFVGGGATLNLTDMLFSQNTASLSGGALFSDESNVAILDSRFERNDVTGTNGQGGAIEMLEGQLDIVGTEIDGNTAMLHGGGISLIDAIAVISNSQVINNTATTGDGGGIAGFGAPDIVIQDTTVDGNVSNRNGGGIAMPNAGKLVASTTSTISNNVASGNRITEGGGGVYNAGALVRVLDSAVSGNRASGTNGAGGGIRSDNGVLNIRQSSVFANQASSFGGGILVGGGFARLEGSTLGGASSADANFAGLNSGLGDGGGLHASNAGTIVEIDSTSVSHNVALRDGGAFWNSADAMLVISNLTFIDNNAASSDVNGGGAIFNKGGTVVISGSTITQNKALGAQSLGGGIHSLGGLVTIATSSINFNEAKRAGGGISIIGGIVTMADSNVTSNTTDSVSSSPGNGGGLYAAMDSFVRLDNTRVSANTASNQGGGLAVYDSVTLVRAGSSIDLNEAQTVTDTTTGGGGIYAQGGILRVLESNIVGNMATGADSAGGGIYSELTTLLVRNSELISNSAVKKGGAANIRNSTASFRGSNIGGVGVSDGNTAERGAGLYFDRMATGWVDGGTVSFNVATQNGGGIFNHPTSNLRVSGGANLSSNTADVGGAIYNAGLMSVVDCSLIGNEARIGGGLSNQPSAITEIDTANIDGNVATFVGGGVQNAGIVKFVDMGEIKNNDSQNTGGGVFTDSIGLTILGDVAFSNNTPDDTNS